MYNSRECEISFDMNRRKSIFVIKAEKKVKFIGTGRCVCVNLKKNKNLVFD